MENGFKDYFFKLTFLVLLAVFLINISVSDVHADMGAKPSICIHVENGPSDYYIALLFRERGNVGKNSQLKLEIVNSETVQKYLEDFFYDDWIFFQSPVGDNIHTAQEDSTYYYGYMVPNRFRIIIISVDGTVYLSEDIDPQEFDSDVTYDVATGTLTENIEDRTVRHILYVAICYLLTLAMELLILKMFKYPFTKRNILCFVLINTITNIPFNFFLINQHSDIVMVFLWLFCEINIMLIESIFYLITLRDAEGKQRKGKSFLYGVVANIVSAILGLVILYVYAMIVSALL